MDFLSILFHAKRRMYVSKNGQGIVMRDLFILKKLFQTLLQFFFVLKEFKNLGKMR